MDDNQQPTAQPALFSDLEDSALLLPELEMRKRYTAQQISHLEWKRSAVEMLLAARYPVDVIARELHLNTRTVLAVAQSSAARVADFSKNYARVMLGVASEAMAVSRAKLHEASAKDAAIISGIFHQRASEIGQTGETVGENVSEIGDDPGQVASEVLRLVRGDSARPMQPVDYVSSGQVLTVNELRTESAGGTGGGTGGGADLVAGPERIESDGGRVGEGRGGGSVSGGVCGKAMEPNDGALQPKADL